MSRLIERAIQPWVEELLGFSPVLVVEGARQTGKSTLARMLRPNAITVNLDDPQTLDYARNDPVGFAAQAGDGVLIIDEFQRLPSLSLAIKANVDADRRPGRFILTGSSDFARVRGDKDSLAGRALSVTVCPLTQTEVRGTTTSGTLVDRLLEATEVHDFPASAEPLTHAGLAHLLTAGGFPAVHNAKPRLRAEWYRNYVERLVRVDALADGSRLTPERLLTVLRLLAAHQSGELVKARLAQDSGLAASSVTSYLDMLARMFLILHVRPWETNLTKREIGRAKVSVLDSGLAAWLCDASPATLTTIPHGMQRLGALTEGFVAGELHAQQQWSRRRYRIHHYRDRNRKEIDFVLEVDDSRLIAIEVKASRTVTGSHLAGLRFLKDKLGPRLTRGVVLAPIDRPASFGDDLWALPLSALWS